MYIEVRYSYRKKIKPTKRYKLLKCQMQNISLVSRHNIKNYRKAESNIRTLRCFLSDRERKETYVLRFHNSSEVKMWAPTKETSEWISEYLVNIYCEIYTLLHQLLSIPSVTKTLQSHILKTKVLIEINHGEQG